MSALARGVAPRARTDPRPSYSYFTRARRNSTRDDFIAEREARPPSFRFFRCVSAMGRCVVVPCAGERLDGGFYVRGALGAVRFDVDSAVRA
jgi:hypothetical protein